MNTIFGRILFDYDGTLIIHDKENEGRQIATLLGINEEQTIVFSKRLSTYFEKHFIIPDKKITYGLQYWNLSKAMEPLEEFGVSAKQLYDAIAENSIVSTKLAEGAKETLEYLLDKGYQLCVFTNGFYKGQVENMKYQGIYEYFEKIYAWDNFYAKPDTRAFIRALGNTAPQHNVMIGDSIVADIIPAKNLGIYTIGINLEGQDMTQGAPDVIISNLSELRQIL